MFCPSHNWSKISSNQVDSLHTHRGVKDVPGDALGRPGGVGTTPLAFFPCNFFDDSNGENRLIVSDTRDGRHILAYVTSS